MVDLDNESKVKMLNIFANMSTTGKFIVAFMIIFVLTFVWDKLDQNLDRAETKELYTLIADQGDDVAALVRAQEDQGKLKAKIAEKFDDAEDEYGRMTDILASTLSKHQVPFPVSLNAARQAFWQKFGAIEDCLRN